MKKIFMIFVLITITNFISYGQNVNESSFNIQFLMDYIVSFEVYFASNDDFNFQLNAAKKLLVKLSGIDEDLLESNLKKNYGISTYQNQIVDGLTAFDYYIRYTRIKIEISVRGNINAILIDQYTTTRNAERRYDRRYSVTQRIYENL